MIARRHGWGRVVARRREVAPLLLHRLAAPPHGISALLRSIAVGVVAVATLAIAPASANDRPYQVARTAVLEEDDENVWSFESWVQRSGSVRGLSIEPEYVFGNNTSVQAEFSRYVDRFGDETGHEAEVEFKHLFNNVGHDGWAWGVSATLAAARTAERDRTVPEVQFKIPLSIKFGEGSGYLHLNAGIGKARGERRAWTAALGVERELARRTTLFGEFAREGSATFLQVGVRHWLRREKLAIDLSVQQQRADGSGGAGFIVGLGYYDF